MTTKPPAPGNAPATQNAPLDQPATETVASQPAAPEEGGEGLLPIVREAGGPAASDQ